MAPRKKSTFILDPHVLLHDPNALMAFDERLVVTR